MKKVLILAAMLLGLSAGVQAQTDNDDEDDVITVPTKTVNRKR